jgi:hypothetical protein
MLLGGCLEDPKKDSRSRLRYHGKVAESCTLVGRRARQLPSGPRGLKVAIATLEPSRVTTKQFRKAFTIRQIEHVSGDVAGSPKHQTGLTTQSI